MDGVNDPEILKLHLRQRLAQLINSDCVVRELLLKLRMAGIYSLDVEMEIDNGFATGDVVSGSFTIGGGFNPGVVDKSVCQLRFSAADRAWLNAMHIDPDPEFE
jgi:hypothetical protein